MTAVNRDFHAMQTLLHWQSQYISMLELELGNGRELKKFQSIKHSINAWGRKLFFSSEHSDTIEVKQSVEAESKAIEDAAHTKTLLRESLSREKEQREVIRRLREEIDILIENSREGNTVLISELDQVRSEYTQRIENEHERLSECQKDNLALREEIVRLSEELDMIQNNSQSFVLSLDEAINFYQSKNASFKEDPIIEFSVLVEKLERIQKENESLKSQLSSAKIIFQSQIESMGKTQKINEQNFNLQNEILTQELQEKKAFGKTMEKKYKDLLTKYESGYQEYADRNERHMSTLRQLLEETKKSFKIHRETSEIEKQKLLEQIEYIKASHRHEVEIAKIRDEEMGEKMKSKDDKISDLAQRLVQAKDRANSLESRLIKEQQLKESFTNQEKQRNEENALFLNNLRTLFFEGRYNEVCNQDPESSNQQLIRELKHENEILKALVEERVQEQKIWKQEREKLASATSALLLLHTERQKHAELSKEAMKVLEESISLHLNELKYEAEQKLKQTPHQIPRSRANTLTLDDLKLKMRESEHLLEQFQQ